jgi:transketolase
MTRSTISPPELDDLCINTLRFLVVDMVQKANSEFGRNPVV